MLEDQVLPTFVNRTADEIIWGYDDPLTKMGREFSEGLKSDQFGLMAGTNYTFYGRFRQSYRYQVLTINSYVITLAQEEVLVKPSAFISLHGQTAQHIQTGAPLPKMKLFRAPSTTV